MLIRAWGVYTGALLMLSCGGATSGAERVSDDETEVNEGASGARDAAAAAGDTAAESPPDASAGVAGSRNAPVANGGSGGAVDDDVHGGAAGHAGGADAECDQPVPALPAWSSAPPFSSLEEQFAAVDAAIVGRWRGVVSTPWIDPYEVELSFGSDGQYAARCVWGSNTCCVAFYYGTDDPTPLKRYALTGITRSGEVSGTVEIAFEYDEGQYGLPGWQGELENVKIDATGDRLRFEFRTSTGYAPVEFDLVRQN